MRGHRCSRSTRAGARDTVIHGETGFLAPDRTLYFRRRSYANCSQPASIPGLAGPTSSASAVPGFNRSCWRGSADNGPAGEIRREWVSAENTLNLFLEQERLSRVSLERTAHGLGHEIYVLPANV